MGLRGLGAQWQRKGKAKAASGSAASGERAPGGAASGGGAGRYADENLKRMTVEINYMRKKPRPTAAQQRQLERLEQERMVYKQAANRIR